MSSSFARDYRMTGEIAATSDGEILGVRSTILADHGAFDAHAQPGEQYPTGFFPIFTSCYDVPAAYAEATGVYSNKAPGGIAYRCSFRVTEAIYLMERTMDVLADELGMDPVELRRKNFVKKEQMPYVSVMGWEYDGGDYDAAPGRSPADSGLRGVARRAEAGPRRGPHHGHRVLDVHGDRGRRTWQEVPHRGHRDVRLRGATACTRPARRSSSSASSRRGRGTRRRSPRSWPANSASRRRTWRSARATRTTRRSGSAPTASRSTPVCGAATAIVSRKVQGEGKKIAAHMLEASPRGHGVDGRALPGQGIPGPGRDHGGGLLRRLHQRP